jgi:WD40 repeat protein
MNDVVNPYIAGNPVTGSKMFFGREDVFKFVQDNLVGQHRDNVIVLSGQRRTGKTSVLYQMRHHLDRHYLCIFLDLHAFALEGLDGFLWELANHITRSLRKEYQIDLPGLNRDQFTIDPRSAFENEFLNQLWSAIDDKHVLLMLDEAVRLQEQVQAGKLGEDIFPYMRHLMQHQERLNFLFSLGSGLEEMEKEYSFLFSIGLYKKISFLDRKAATALITEPAKDYYRVEAAALERILQMTSGHPYYTQLMCHSLFNRWKQRRFAQIEVKDVNEVLDEVVERGLAVLKHVWEESTPSEKAVMAGLYSAMGEQNRPVEVEEINHAWTPCEVVMPKGEMAKAIHSMIAREVIVGRDAYVFTIDLQRLWVQKYRRLEWVKEEITDAVREWSHLPVETITAGRTPLPKRYISRRTILISLAGIAGLAAAGANIAWRVLFDGRPVLTFHGHSLAVYDVGWSPDGTKLASASQDKTVQVWDAATGKVLRIYRGHSGSVNALAWLPDDGTRIASAGDDMTVQVCDVATGNKILTYRGHSANMRTLGWTSDGMRIASGGDDNTVQVWNAISGKHLLTYHGHSSRVWSVSLSPDDQHIASGSDDKTVQVWDTVTGNKILTYFNGRHVKAVAWSPHGGLIASGGDGAAVKIWNAPTGSTLLTYPGHSGTVLTIAWSPDGSLIASGGDDTVVQVWSASSGKMLFSYTGHSLAVHSVAWSHDGKRIASAGDDRTVQVWSPF